MWLESYHHHCRPLVPPPWLLLPHCIKSLVIEVAVPKVIAVLLGLTALDSFWASPGSWGSSFGFRSATRHSRRPSNEEVAAAGGGNDLVHVLNQPRPTSWAESVEPQYLIAFAVYYGPPTWSPILGQTRRTLLLRLRMRLQSSLLDFVYLVFIFIKLYDAVLRCTLCIPILFFNGGISSMRFQNLFIYEIKWVLKPIFLSILFQISRCHSSRWSRRKRCEIL